jgi:hypothetical protein
VFVEQYLLPTIHSFHSPWNDDSCPHTEDAFSPERSIGGRYTDQR